MSVPTNMNSNDVQGSVLSGFTTTKLAVLHTLQIMFGIFTAVCGSCLTACRLYRGASTPGLKKFKLANNEEISIPDFDFIGYGIWIGMLFVMVGGFGLVSLKWNTKKMVGISVGLNVVSLTIFSPALFTFAFLQVVGCRNMECFEQNLMNEAYYVVTGWIMFTAMTLFLMSTWSVVIQWSAICMCCSRKSSTQFEYSIMKENEEESIKMESIGAEESNNGRHVNGAKPKPVSKYDSEHVEEAQHGCVWCDRSDGDKNDWGTGSLNECRCWPTLEESAQMARGPASTYPEGNTMSQSVPQQISASYAWVANQPYTVNPNLSGYYQTDQQNLSQCSQPNYYSGYMYAQHPCYPPPGNPYVISRANN